MKKVAWGILSTAKIGREKVIPALQLAHFSRPVSNVGELTTRAGVTCGERR